MRIVLMALLLVGCASPPPPQQYEWRKAGASYEERYTDGGQCEAQAKSATGGQGAPMTMNSALFMLAQQRGIFDACMRGKGWVLVPL